MKARGAILSLFAALILAMAWPARALTIFTYQRPESGRDRRFDYDTAVLRLALEKTRAEYGDFRLQASPAMNRARAIEDARLRAYPNFFVKLSYTDELAGKGLAYARFPVDRGIVGYRVCFVRSALKEKLAAVRRVADLRRFTQGVGVGWADAGVLKANGFTVLEASRYESLFPMVAAGRFDLLCRGANELLGEYRTHRDIPKLDYDRSIAIVYPLPRFFFTSSANGSAIARLTKGLRIAHADGSLQKLWEAQYRQSIDFARLKSRRIFRIENPLLRGIDFDFRKYDYDPLKN